MPTLSQTIQMRERQRENARRTFAPRLGLIVAVLISLAIAIAGLLLPLNYARLTADLPSIDALPGLIEPPDGIYLQPTRFYDRTGEHRLLTLQNPASSERAYLRYPVTPTTDNPAANESFLPASLITATIVAIDPGFWSHPGFKFSIGSSDADLSIAQRLVAELVLNSEPEGSQRNLRAKLLAVQITDRYGREKVLEWYLNSAYFGNLAFGAEAAAQLYLGKPASELDFAEAALLAGIADDPKLNPLDAPQAAYDRQRQIVQEALRQRLITPEEGIAAFRVEPAINPSAQQARGLQIADLEPRVAPAFAGLALEQLAARLPSRSLERGGLRIITTLDFDIQSQVDCASHAQRVRLATIQTETSPGIPIDCPAARLLPSLLLGGETPLSNLEVEVVVLDPHNGQILALSSDSNTSPRIDKLPAHPAGSLATVFVYMTGFTRGLSPATLLWDIPPNDGGNHPQNLDGKYHGPIRLRNAFANDYLAPADQVLAQVGIENVLRTTQQLGIQDPKAISDLPKTSLSLLRSLDLLEASHALSIFANQGTMAGRAVDVSLPGLNGASSPITTLPPLQAAAILRVEKNDGTILLDWNAPQNRPILTPQLAYIMTNVLSDETARWPSLGHPNPLEIGRPAAAKISGTPGGDSNWVIGYTPKRLVGVWMGTEPIQAESHNLSVTEMHNATTGLWHAIMQYASRDIPYEAFSVPAGLSSVQVCDPSGLLPTAACPNVVDEVFLNGNEPVQIDTLYRLVAINRETQRLATIFTPPDLVEQRAFISVPTEAEHWAAQAGMETPPDTYDVLPLQLPIWEGTRISSPQMFASLRGRVNITGDAYGPGFAFYRLQYGKGPIPQKWYQIDEDSQNPVTDGNLGVWDTTGLEDLYAIQLLVVREDQSVERSTILLTIDNQPPEVKILNPLPAETIRVTERPRIVLQADVTEGLSIGNVLFKIDGQTIATLTQAPYAISWTVSAGSHVFQVVATDSAGNSSQAQLNFSAR
jgi:membrane peptidoglycan carboxypeptidase